MDESSKLEKYRPITGIEEEAEIRQLADRVNGASILHVNSTRSGGGVAEILKSLIPLANSLGLRASWEVITASPRFFDITKSIHNALQGMNLPLTREMKDTYMKVNQSYADTLTIDQDVVMIHDPQPAPLIRYTKKGKAKWIWRCHIDLSQPNSDYWLLVRQFVERYDALIFSIEDFVKRDLRNSRLYIMSPCIDPLSEKNKEVSEKQIIGIARRLGIDRELPIITQVSRFDPWKDPLGVIDVYRIIRRSIPKLQLLMVGGSAQDDPEGEIWRKKVLEYAGKDIDRGVHLLTDLTDLEVNALQRTSDVIVQKSIREGFGLTVAEALWKGIPVVATNVGGIPLQVIDGVTGYLIGSTQDAADRILSILRKPELGDKLGQRGKEHIRKNFLITRHLKQYLKMHLDLLQN